MVGAGAPPEEVGEPDPELVLLAVAAGRVEVTTGEVAEGVKLAAPASTVK